MNFLITRRKFSKFLSLLHTLVSLSFYNDKIDNLSIGGVFILVGLFAVLVDA
jgi:hypothetical protein